MKTSVLSSLNFNEFLKDGTSNHIVIYYNGDWFKEKNPTVPSGDFEKLFKGKWLFYENIHDAENSRLITFDTFDFTVNAQPWDILTYYNILQEAVAKWENFCPLIPFPDIRITCNNYHSSSAFLSYDKLNQNHYIYLTLEELSSPERFKYVLGHELGHLFFNIELKREYEQNLSKKIFPKLFPWEGLIISTIQVALLTYSIWNEKLNVVHFLIFANCFIFITYFLINLVTITPRLMNYSAEFFSDYFSFWFLGPVEVEKIGIKEDKYNVYTHPSNNFRTYQLGKFKHINELKNWENPIFTHSKYFRAMNLYEYSYLVSLKVQKTKYKILSYFKK